MITIGNFTDIKTLLTPHPVIMFCGNDTCKNNTHKKQTFMGKDGKSVHQKL